MAPAEDLKAITAGRNGEYVPFRFYEVKEAEPLMEQVKEVVDATGDWDTAFSGSFFSNRKMLDELVVILLYSILLMYFILAAQFEVLGATACSVVGDTDTVAIALVLLWICGHTLNSDVSLRAAVLCSHNNADRILSNLKWTIACKKWMSHSPWN